MSKEDVRVINTKRFLKKTLIELLKEKKLLEINVKELCSKAEVNRTTFYFHYKSIEELFDEMIGEYMDNICMYVNNINDCMNGEERTMAFYSFIKYIDKNSTLFTLMFENSNADISSKKQYQILQDRIKARTSKEDISKYITNYYIHAGGSVLYTWIENGKKESIGQIAMLLHDLLTKGASKFM